MCGGNLEDIVLTPLSLRDRDFSNASWRCCKINDSFGFGWCWELASDDLDHEYPSREDIQLIQVAWAGQEGLGGHECRGPWTLGEGSHAWVCIHHP